MADLISRQDAIDAICKACSAEGDYHKCDGYPETSTWCDELVALRALPSAEPEKRTNERTETHTCDLISRQALLDAFGLSAKTRKYGGDHSGYDTRMLYEIQDVIEGMPSAEPSPKQHKSFDYPTELHPCAGCKWEDSLYIGCRMCRRNPDEREDLWEAN